MGLGLTNTAISKHSFPVMTHESLARPAALSQFNNVRMLPKLIDSRHAISLKTPSSHQRLAQMRALPQQQPGLPPENEPDQTSDLAQKKPNINSKGIEVLDSDWIGEFITADGYPLDVYMDKALANFDLTDINTIYKLKYSLDHDDRNGHRTLQISDHFPVNDSFYAKIMRDTIYGQWINVEGTPVLDLSMHVNDNAEGKGPLWETSARNSDLIPDPLAMELAKIGGEMRKKIFQDHVQDALQAMAIGTTNLVKLHPELGDATTRLRFLSDIASVAETVESGTVNSHLEKPILDKKSPIAQITGNIKVWSDAINSSTRATRQLMNAMLKPESLGPLLQNPKTVLPTLALLIALGIIAAHNQSNTQ